MQNEDDIRKARQRNLLQRIFGGGGQQVWNERLPNGMSSTNIGVPPVQTQAPAYPQQLPAPQPAQPATVSLSGKALPSITGATPSSSYPDYLGQDEANLRRLQLQKDPFWKRLASAAIRAGQAATGQPISPMLTSRERDIGRLQGWIGQDANIAKTREDILSAQALRRNRELEPQVEQARLDLERQRVQGVIDDREYQRQKNVLDRQSREKIAAEANISREKAAGIRARGAGTGEDKVDIRQRGERARKKAAAEAEYQQLLKDEATAGENKNAAYEYLAKLKADTTRPQSDIDEATKAAENANKEYQSYTARKTDAQTRIRENTDIEPAVSSNPPAPQGVSEASIRREARRRGKNEDEAVKKARGYGWIP